MLLRHFLICVTSEYWWRRYKSKMMLTLGLLLEEIALLLLLLLCENRLLDLLQIGTLVLLVETIGGRLQISFELQLMILL